MNHGFLGVTIFFVISGFLISGLLFEEHERTGTISLFHFYVRRTLRIFPAYYAYVGIISVAAYIGWIHLAPGDLTAALTYTMNYHTEYAWYLAQSWSLAVEEQFYLVWPLTVLLIGPRRSLFAAGGLLVVAPLLRFGLWHFGLAIYPRGVIGRSFETIGDSIAIGCMLAGVRDWLWNKSLYRRCLRSQGFIVVPFIPVLMSCLSTRPRIYAFAHSAALVCIAITIDRCIRFPAGKLGRLLNSRGFIYIGGLSYSLYVWQQPFLNRHVTGLWASFPLNLVLAVTVALISYYLVEKPGLRFRQRIEPMFRRRPLSGVPTGPGPCA